MRKTINTLFLTIATILAASCADGTFPLVPREELTAAETENSELRSSLSTLQENYNKQNKELSYVLSELASICNQTSQIRLHSGETPLSELDLVKEDLASLKERIAYLEKQAARARKYNKDLAIATTTIRELKETVNNQEKEITLLRKTLTERENTIHSQKEVISTQRDTILRQNASLLAQKEELAKTVKQQTELIYNAGIMFGLIADEGDFKISGRKNRDNVKAYRRRIYEEAVGLYKMAASQGHEASRDSIISVTLRMKLMQ